MAGVSRGDLDACAVVWSYEHIQTDDGRAFEPVLDLIVAA
jgi:hypothetical protein